MRCLLEYLLNIHGFTFLCSLQHYGSRFFLMPYSCLRSHVFLFLPTKCNCNTYIFSYVFLSFFPMLQHICAAVFAVGECYLELCLETSVSKNLALNSMPFLFNSLFIQDQNRCFSSLRTLFKKRGIAWCMGTM